MDPFTLWIAVAIIGTATAYSIIQQRQMAKRQKAAQEAAKGLEVPVEAEVKALPVAYGRCLVGGVRVFHKTSGTYLHQASAGPYFKEFLGGSPPQYSPSYTTQVLRGIFIDGEGGGFFPEYDPNGVPIYDTVTVPAVQIQSGSTLITDRYPGKNVVLFMQQAICLGEIEEIVDVVIDPNRYYNNLDFKYGLRVNTYRKGFLYDPMIEKNIPERLSSVFSEMAYASMCFILNRDSPQFQGGVPVVQFMIKGRKLRSIEKTGETSYQLSVNETYSNNPARVLLDYLRSPLYGLGLQDAEIDLESFYKAQQICDITVRTMVPGYGHIWVPSSSGLYTTPSEEANDWHPFLKQNGVWDYLLETDGNWDSYLSPTFNRTFNLYIETPGVYNFVFSADDYLDISIDGQPFFTHNNNMWWEVKNQTYNFTQGSHVITISAVNTGGSAAIALLIEDITPEKNVIFNLKNPQFYQHRNLPLYECNLLVDPENTVRDNIEDILETMNKAELVWSNGKYKLILNYPQTQSALDAIVVDTLTDDDIIKDSFSMKWPNASERLNFCTVKFSNEALDFKDDSVSWPNKIPTDPGDTVYATYLAEDNNVRLEADFYEKGIKDYYHAKAKAEERVRTSRSSVVYDFKTNIKALLYEPGDIVKINSAIMGLNNHYVRIQEVKTESDFTVSVSAVRFQYEDLAWNVNDTEIIGNQNKYLSKVFQKPFNISFSNNVLSWEDATNTSTINYKIFSWYGGPRTVNGVSPFTDLNIDPTYFIKLTELTRVFYGSDYSIIQAVALSNSSTIAGAITTYLTNNSINSAFTGDNETIVRNLYLKFLKREPELEGFQYWLNVLDNNLNTTAGLMEFFLDVAYSSNLYFTELTQTNAKQATIEALPGIYVFSVKGIDSIGNQTELSIANRFYETNYPLLSRSISINPSSTNFYTVAGGAPSPAEITLIAVASNFVSPTYEWYIDGVNQNNATDTLVIQSFAAGAVKVITVNITDTADSFLLSQTISIPSIADGMEYDVEVESTNGDTFRIGQANTTTLIAHVFLNGAEVTNSIPASRFRWRRVSRTPQPYPNDDDTWNNIYSSGYKQIEVTIDGIYAIATFHCDLLSE